MVAGYSSKEVNSDDIFTLFWLAQTLADMEELDLDVALNLDGGTSSGMFVRAGTENSPWYPETDLPIVITARRK